MACWLGHSLFGWSAHRCGFDANVSGMAGIFGFSAPDRQGDGEGDPVSWAGRCFGGRDCGGCPRWCKKVLFQSRFTGRRSCFGRSSILARWRGQFLGNSFWASNHVADDAGVLPDDRWVFQGKSRQRRGLTRLLLLRMTKFNHCPNRNCGKRPDGGFFGGAYMTIYECRDCGFRYCYKCGDQRCPECGSKKRGEAGRCYAK